MLKPVDQDLSLSSRRGDTSTSGRTLEPVAALRWDNNTFSATSKLMISGGLAGAVSKTCTAPLARLTIICQVQAASMAGGITTGSCMGSVARAGLVQSLSQLVQREGILSLWKGNTAAIIHRLPYSSINFYTYEQTCQLLDTLSQQGVAAGLLDNSILKRLAAGGTAGLVACTAAYPLDLVRTRLAFSSASKPQSTNIANVLSSILRSQGLPGLYSGLGATLVQVVPSISISFCVYESLKASLKDNVKHSSAATVASTLFCGSMSGLASSSVTFPLDTIRKRLQMNGCPSHDKRMSYTDVARVIYQQRGWRGFYAGIIPEYCKVVPGVAIAFGTYEVLKHCLGLDTGMK